MLVAGVENVTPPSSRMRSEPRAPQVRRIVARSVPLPPFTVPGGTPGSSAQLASSQNAIGVGQVLAGSSTHTFSLAELLCRVPPLTALTVKVTTCRELVPPPQASAYVFGLNACAATRPTLFPRSTARPPRATVPREASSQ